MSCRLAPPVRRALIPLFVLAGTIISSCGPEGQAPTSPSVESSVPAASPVTGLSLALAAQSRNTDRLLAIKGVVGTAVTLDRNGKGGLQVFTENRQVEGLPATLEGTPVSVIVTGPIRSLVATAPAGAVAMAVNRTARFARPVPIGISTGNQRECISGTIGARVKSGTTLFALSNNHVYALENSAPIGSNVLQPGQADLNCSGGTNARLGKLSRFARITFSRTANNRVDAAIASVTSGDLRRGTPSDGYGTPRATTVAASLNQAVRKYGRTTGLTSGRVVGLNATVLVGYSGNRTARFVGQIVIQNSGEFSGPGDSGSLIVDGTRRPIGLLFAGSPRERDGSGGFTIANPINQVLNALNVRIDGTT
jgi:hypothetical protein